MDKFEQELLDNQTKHRRWAKYALFGGVFLLVFTPFIFTRTAWFDWIVFKDTGAIGDTIGGITAPFLNLAGAVLIYLSFSQQMEANKIQFNALKDDKIEKKDLQIFSFIEKLDEEIAKEISKISYIGLNGYNGLTHVMNTVLKHEKIHFPEGLKNSIFIILIKNKLLLNRINSLHEREYKQILFQKNTIDFYRLMFTSEISEMIQNKTFSKDAPSWPFIKLLIDIDKLNEKIDEDLFTTL